MINIIIIGGGTGAIEVKGIIDDINRVVSTYQIVGLLDDDPSLWGGGVAGMPVLGGLDMARTFEGVKYVFAIGSISTQHKRNAIQNSLGIDSGKFESLIHPTAIINASASIGRGCIVHPRVLIGNDVSIGDFCIIAVSSSIGPYAKIQNFAMVTSHVLILSHAQIGSSAFIGSMSCVIEKVRIGELSRIGVGSIVGRDIADGVFAMGNPIRLLGLNH